MEEEAILLGKKVELPEVPGSLLECLEIPTLAEPTKQANTPKYLFSSIPHAPT